MLDSFINEDSSVKNLLGSLQLSYEVIFECLLKNFDFYFNSNITMALTENEKRHDKKEKPLTKVIIRRLPPSMDQETFLNQVSPIPEYNYIYTAKGDSSLGEFAFSRVYINFVNSHDVYDFKERFDNYVFLDGRGHEYPAVVEFAQFQKIPKKRGKARMDPKCGTLESDPVFQEFLESLNKPKEQEEKPEYTLQLTSENKNDVTTPLLEFIKNKRAQKLRIREVRREERKRREFDKRKERYDDRKKNIDDRSSSKPIVSNNVSPKSEPTKEEKHESQTTVSKLEEKTEKNEKVYEKSFYKSKDKKYDEKKFEERKYDEKRKDIKSRYPKKDYYESRDYKRQDDYRERDHRSKYEDFKKDEKNSVKKVKKYSERREERKLEVQKSEQKKLDVDSKKVAEKITKEDLPSPKNNLIKNDLKSIENEIIKDEAVVGQGDTQQEHDVNKKQVNESKSRESDSHSQRRIRNKDRPTIAIYRPGMLSKRKQNEADFSESNDSKSSETK